MPMWYKCNNEVNGGCKKRKDDTGFTVNTLNTHDPKIIQQLPRHLASEFPAVLTYRGSISRTLAKLMRPCIQSAMGVERVISGGSKETVKSMKLENKVVVY